MGDSSSADIFDAFIDLAAWTRFDEWSGICVELADSKVTDSKISGTTKTVCAFFGEDQEGGYKLLILGGYDPAYRYLQYRNGEWIPEFGLDFATTDGIKITIQDEEITGYLSYRLGQPPEELRMDEKQLMFEVLDAINFLVKSVDEEKVPLLGESEEWCYHLWKVGKTWRADVKDFPEEKFIHYPAIEVSPDRLKRLTAAGLPREGVWEATPFYLPVTRFQGDQEVFVQCAAVAERLEDVEASGLLGLVTLEAHADPEQELIEAILGSIEKQKRFPQFVIVKDEKVAERILPILHPLGIQIRLRRHLRELARIREEMIDEFPDEEDEN